MRLACMPIVWLHAVVVVSTFHPTVTWLTTSRSIYLISRHNQPAQARLDQHSSQCISRYPSICCKIHRRQHTRRVRPGTIDGPTQAPLPAPFCSLPVPRSLLLTLPLRTGLRGSQFCPRTEFPPQALQRRRSSLYFYLCYPASPTGCAGGGRLTRDCNPGRHAHQRLDLCLRLFAPRSREPGDPRVPCRSEPAQKLQC